MLYRECTSDGTLAWNKEEHWALQLPLSSLLYYMSLSLSVTPSWPVPYPERAEVLTMRSVHWVKTWDLSPAWHRTSNLYLRRRLLLLPSVLISIYFFHRSPSWPSPFSVMLSLPR